MKALIAPGNGSLRVEDVAMPAIGDYDCLVKIKSCLFCNSTDRHIVDNTFNFGIPYPAILGHESLGQVVSMGAGVKNFTSGDWVIRPYAIYPDEVSNNIGSGWGGFAEFGKIKDFQAMVSDGAMKAENIPGFFKYMQKLPKELSPDKCMLISCLKEIYSSVKQILPVGGRSFLVAGAGAAGCLFALFLKMAGAASVTVTARRREQLDFASRNTAADYVTPLNELAAGHSFDALVDTTGSAETVIRLLDDSVKPGGCFYSYAVYPEMLNSKLWESFKEKTRFQRIDPVEASVHEEVCQMLINGKLASAANYISQTFTIDQAEKAWSTVTGKKVCKTAIVFN